MLFEKRDVTLCSGVPLGSELKAANFRLLISSINEIFNKMMITKKTAEMELRSCKVRVHFVERLVDFFLAQL